MTTMALEVLLNQPFKKKIKIFHNFILRPLMKNRSLKVERIENNTFGFSLLIVLRTLYLKDNKLSAAFDIIFEYCVLHWSVIHRFNEKEYFQKNLILKELWIKNKHLAFSADNESLVDLIFELYRSFEIGVGDKSIIKENIAALIYSVSKTNKEFRLDVLKEFKRQAFKKIKRGL